MTTGELIKSARVKSGLKQVQLAARMGVSQARISEYEQGHKDPTVGTLQKIAAALDCEVEIFFRKNTK